MSGWSSSSGTKPIQASRERLLELFEYEPATGLLRRRRNGVAAGGRTHNGYLRVLVDGYTYAVHRLAWLMVTGEQPIEIDHINGVRDDNRFQNLRNCTRAENNENFHNSRSNPPELMGASYDPRRRKWNSKISVRGRSKFLGSFPTREEAISAYRAAKRELHTFQPHLLKAG